MVSSCSSSNDVFKRHVYDTEGHMSSQHWRSLLVLNPFAGFLKIGRGIIQYIQTGVDPRVSCTLHLQEMDCL